jgi:hypothetical protein
MLVKSRVLTLQDAHRIFAENGYVTAKLLKRYQLGNPESILAVGKNQSGTLIDATTAFLVRQRRSERDKRITIRAVELKPNKKIGPVSELLRYTNVYLYPKPLNNAATRAGHLMHYWYHFVPLEEWNRIINQVFGDKNRFTRRPTEGTARWQ